MSSVADPGCLYRIPDPNFFSVKNIPDLGPASKNLRIFNPKNCFKALGKGIQCSSRIRTFSHPGSRSGSRIQGSKKHRIPDAERIRSTDHELNIFRPKKLNQDGTSWKSAHVLILRALTEFIAANYKENPVKSKVSVSNLSLTTKIISKILFRIPTFNVIQPTESTVP